MSSERRARMVYKLGANYPAQASMRTLGSTEAFHSLWMQNSLSHDTSNTTFLKSFHWISAKISLPLWIIAPYALIRFVFNHSCLDRAKDYHRDAAHMQRTSQGSRKKRIDAIHPRGAECADYHSTKSRIECEGKESFRTNRVKVYRTSSRYVTIARNVM